MAVSAFIDILAASGNIDVPDLLLAFEEHLTQKHLKSFDGKNGDGKVDKTSECCTFVHVQSTN